MERIGKILLVFLIALTISFMFGSIAGAEGADTADKALNKLTRGVGNTGLGMAAEIKDHTVAGGQEGEYVEGFFKGFGYGSARTLVGIYEGLTFSVPLPSDYEPIMEKKYSWEGDI